MLVDKDGKSLGPWMAAGETWRDSAGRTLVITKIDEKSPPGRNVIGTVDGTDYACDLLVFQAVWKEKVSG